MFTKGVRCLGLIALLTGWVAQLQGAVISYNFGGTLSQPMDGSSTFTGTITYDTDLQLSPTIAPSAGGTYYSGMPVNPAEPTVSLTFTIGNTPSSAYGAISGQQVFVSHEPPVNTTTPSHDQFLIGEQLGTGNQTLNVQFILTNNNLVQPAPLTSFTPPSSLNLSSFSQGGALAMWGMVGGQLVDELATITTLSVAASDGGSSGGDPPVGGSPGDELPVPEPGSLIVFACLGAAFVARFRPGRRQTPWSHSAAGERH